VFALSVDSPFVVDRFRQAENIPFPVLSDFNKSVCRAYDAIHEDLMGLHGIAKRSAFVVGADGRIVYAWVSEDPRTQVDFEAIRQAVASA
jgi:peroxiredoxin